jgi:BirA family biotin operon repressor/biotin-[acetyl-CoA-carboxylase] ligase
VPADERVGGLELGPEERLAAGFDGLPADVIRERWGVPALLAFERLGSTNDVARRWVAAGAPAGAVVVADRQLAGRGRAGRGWDSPASLGLWVSMVVAPPPDAGSAGALPLRAGVAVARALDGYLRNERTGLKWPNDLILRGAKVGGILCEGSYQGSAPGPVVVGVGLNLLQEAGDFPPDLRDSAVSLRAAAVRRFTRQEVGERVIRSLTRHLVEEVVPAPALAAELQERDVLRGRTVHVTEPATGKSLASGVALGIAPDGALLLHEASGELRVVRSGTVRLEPDRSNPAHSGRS